MVQLEIFSPDGKSETVTLDKFPVTIGRSRINDIVLTHRTVSRKHAVIIKKDGNYLIKDVGSQNGTFLRKRKIEEALLQNEDVIYIGAYTLKFLVKEEIIDLDKALEGPETAKKVKLKITHVLEIPDRFHGVIFPEVTGEEEKISEVELSISQEDTSLLAFPDEFLVPREEFPTLYDLQRRAMEDENLEDTLNNVANYLLSRTDGDRVAFFLSTVGTSLDAALIVTRPGIAFESRDIKAFPSILRKSIQEGKAILANGLEEDSNVQIDQKERDRYSSYSAIFAPLKYDEKTVGAIQIETHQGKDRLDRDQLVFVCRVIRELGQIIIWKLGQIEKFEQRLLKQELSRIHPEEIVDILFQKGEKYKQEFFEVKEQVSSVLTCRISNLSDIHDQISPMEIQQLLQHFISTVRKSVIQYKGSILDISGGEVVGIFGLPIKQLDAAVRAVLAALNAINNLEKDSTFNKLTKKPVFSFGIQTGLVTGGDIPVNAFHYLFAIGNTVEVSRELTGLAEETNQILISPEVFFDVRFYFDIEEIGLKEITKTQETMMVYQVLRLKESVSEESILYLASENADSEVTSEEFLKFPDV